MLAYRKIVDELNGETVTGVDWRIGGGGGGMRVCGQ